MKKVLSVFAMTAFFAACNNNPKTNTDTPAAVTTADTSTLNRNAFTDKAQEVQLNGVSDTIISNDGNAYVKVKPKEAEPTAVVNEKPVINEKPVVNKKSTVRHTTSTRRANSAGSDTTTTSKSKSAGTTVSTGTSGSTGTDTAATTTTETKKKGWSKAAKSTVIGAGTGAAAGAIISKKKGKGAIIGGIIGAGGGYIYGRSKDKKDGRYLQDTNANSNPKVQ